MVTKHDGLLPPGTVDPNAPDTDTDSIDDDSGSWLDAFGARLSASFDLAIGKLGDTMLDHMDEMDERYRQRIREETRALPAMAKVATTFTYSTAATASVTTQGGTGIGVLLGGPEIGRQWNVRQLFVGGTTITAAPTGQAWLFITAGLPNDLSPTSVMDRAGSLPLVSFYGTDEVYVQPNESVWIVITGGTNATQYLVTMSFQDTAFIPRGTVEVI